MRSFDLLTDIIAFHHCLLDKVRLLYDANQPTARIVVRSKKDLDTPLVGVLDCYILRGLISFFRRI